jgi:hypothetical protein
LTVGGGFDALISSLGLTEADVNTMDVGSPFDHAKQGILYVASELPAPDRDGVPMEALDTLAELIEAAGGRTLALFSSWRGVERAAEYLRVRRQFGRPIGSFQALQHRLVDMYLHLRLSKAALSVALAQGDEAATPALTLMAARARHRACATTTRIVREAIQLHGAIGYTEQCDVSLYVQRALVMSARFGGARTLLAASSLGLGAEVVDVCVPVQLAGQLVGFNVATLLLGLSSLLRLKRTSPVQSVAVNAYTANSSASLSSKAPPSELAYALAPPTVGAGSSMPNSARSSALGGERWSLVSGSRCSDVARACCVSWRDALYASKTARFSRKADLNTRSFPRSLT